ncbi:MAG: hypothetical protein ABID67_02175 [Candidatus Nealsonbacteria bacterium]
MDREKTYDIKEIEGTIVVLYFGNKVSFLLVFDDNGNHVDPWVGQELGGTFLNMMTFSGKINYVGIGKFGEEAKKVAQNYLIEKYKDKGKKLEGEKKKEMVPPWWTYD